MAKLSLIVRELVSSGSLQGKAEGLVESILQKLRSWKRDVPAQLQWPAKDSSLDPLAATLNVGFHQVQILACLGQAKRHQLVSAISVDTERVLIALREEVAYNAQQICIVAAQITTNSQELMLPHEFFQAIFTAGVAAFTQLQSNSISSKQIGRMALSNCSLVLNSVREAYDPVPWMINVLKRLSEMADSGTEDSDAVQGSTMYSSSAAARQESGGMSPGQNGGSFDDWLHCFPTDGDPFCLQTNLDFSAPGSALDDLLRM